MSLKQTRPFAGISFRGRYWDEAEIAFCVAQSALTQNGLRLSGLTGHKEPPHVGPRYAEGQRRHK
jgi:hypothetical protein